MSSCERCWRDAYSYDPYCRGAEEYHRLIKERVGPLKCTPEQQAGPDGQPCAECSGRMVLHQLTGECMANPEHTGSAKWARFVESRRPSGVA